ncbi:glycoside hydrolase superfamily [Aspergillus granulosus]|uniref:chitinase n=1 Tax=Aspergillus granulosus TaxID=176169 RepID=A0ABR4H1Q4_9EURO
MASPHPLSRPATLLVAWLFLLATFLHHTSASECSGTTLCPSGCCSKYGFCGFSSDHCGAGCLSICDGECSADIPCKVGCCSKNGTCGFGEEYCSTEQGCVNNCGLKSECDAGWGLEWAESKTCPLNVCCSKSGFCGTTGEFCGEDDEFDRPACDVDSHRIERVIGYYEQWSLERPCHRVSPEAIPAGYYTHINVAFAGIDPETFEITGSASGDHELWTRVQSLRLEQPSVEIWIALGGRVFNDPDQPTRTTFSDIARSEENQKVFAKSLLSMMSKYGFDGVDIDWEYPVAEERSGREEDYQNFPKWMKNLRSLLHSSGIKYGLSLTLPASYSYLQHFDIKKLEESVDWLNVMTYDMHGTWVGPYLNPHTNLTKIKNSMDLLWRNDIDPRKVVMGMAFYGRTFTLADPGCTEPGCTYRSGGNAGGCSQTVGFLLNSEIQDTIESLGLTPTLYEEDAVKVVTFRDQWVSYDDEETFKIRGDYARSQCMGGVMVWAISHDDRNHTSAKALTSGVGRKRMDFPNYPKIPPPSVEKQQETKALGGPSHTYELSADIADMPEAQLCSHCSTTKDKEMQKPTNSGDSENSAQGLETINSAYDESATTTITDPLIDIQPTDNTTTTLDCISDTHYTTQAGDTCDSIATAQSVSAGTLYAINPTLLDCTSIPAGLSLCLPQPCTTAQVQSSDTCISLGVTYGASWRSIIEWNGAINYGCTNLVDPSPFWGKTICVSAPGDPYIFRVGNGSIGETAHPGYSGWTPIDLPADAVVAPNTTINCGLWYTATDSLTCEQITMKYLVSADQFIAYNPSLDAGNCTASLQEGLTYCALATWGWDYDEEDNIPWGEWVDVEVSMPVSMDGSCGVDTTCLGSGFGDCCVAMKCGGSEKECMAENCKAFYGGCGKEFVRSNSTAASTPSCSST